MREEVEELTKVLSDLVRENRELEVSSVHFGNFVTGRAAKSIISSKCVFNPSYGLPGVFKIKILYLDLILDHI